MAQTVSELARQLNRLNAKKSNLPTLILMTDSKRLPNPSAIIPQLPANSAVVVRDLSDKKKEKIILKINKLCRKHKVKLLVSDAPKLAIKHRLDGIHFSEKSTKKIAAAGSFQKIKPHLILTAACHSYKAAICAERAGLDAVLISPVFATKSHPNVKTLGPVKLQNLAHNLKISAYALGGINTQTAKRLISTKISGFAGIEGLV